MKTVLVTGANRGIGLEISKELGAREFQVWLSARNKDSGREATESLISAGIDAHFVTMDVADLDSIKAAFKIVSKELKTIDVLVNNAGINFHEPPDILKSSPEIVHETLNTNVLGVLFVTQVFSPLLVNGSRVINVSSGVAQIANGMGSYSPVYSVSKAAMNAVTCQLAHAFKARGVAVNAVSPGWVRSDMGGSSAPRSLEQGAETPVWLATEAPIDKTGLFWYDLKTIPW